MSLYTPHTDQQSSIRPINQRPVNQPSRYRYDAVPEAMRERPQWVLWRYSNGKKYPFNPAIDPESRVNELARTNDPSTWGTFEQAMTVLRTGLQQRAKAGHLYRLYADGIGFVFTKDDPFAGVDYDKCYSGDELAPGIRASLERMQTYCERSQSRNGVKAIGLYSDLATLKTQSVEVYTDTHFFALTGDVIPGISTALANIGDEVTMLLKLHQSDAKRTRQANAQSMSGGISGALDWNYVKWLREHMPRLVRSDWMPHVALLNCPASQQLHALITNGTIPPALLLYNDSDSECRAVVAHSTAKLHMMPEERYVLLDLLVQRHGWQGKQKARDLDNDYHRLIFERYPVATDTYAMASRRRFADFSGSPQAEETVSAPTYSEPRPAHRPSGAKATQVARLHKMLEAMANDEGTIEGYSTEDYADRFNQVYSRQRAISRYSMRDYIRAGVAQGLWSFEQPKGNDLPVLTLKQRVICHPKPTEAVETAPESPVERVTDESPINSNTMPQSVVSEEQCTKEEGENTVFLFGAPLVSSDAVPSTNATAPAEQPTTATENTNGVLPSSTPVRTARTPREKESHRWDYEDERDCMRRTEAYRPTARDEYLSELRKARRAPRTLADDELLAVLSSCAEPAYAGPFSIEGLLIGDAECWRVYDDSSDQVIASYPTERAARDDVRWRCRSVLTA